MCQIAYRRRIANCEVAARVLPIVQVTLALPVLIVAAYWVKSALGIDLMEGPSPLHDWLYWR